MEFLKSGKRFLAKNELIKKAIFDTNIYFLAQVGTKGLSILVVPVLARTLTIKEFAIYDLFFVLTTLFSTLVTMGLESGTGVLINQDKDKKWHTLVFSASLIISIAANIVVFLITLLFVKTGAFSIDTTLVYYLFLYLAIYAPNVIIFNFLRWKELAKKASIAQFVISLFGLTLGISFLFIYPENKVFSYLNGLIIGNSLGFAINLYFVKEFIGVKQMANKFHRIPEILKVSLPFLPSNFGTRLLLMSDRLIIISILGETALGLYALAAKVSQILNFIVEIVVRGTQPVLLNNYEKPNGIKLFHYLSKGYILSIICTFFLFALISKPIVQLMGGNKYMEITTLVPILSLSVLIYGSNYFSSLAFMVKKKSIIISLVVIFTAIVNFVLSYFLSIHFSLEGVAVGTLFSVGLGSFILFYQSEKIIPLNNNLTRLGLTYAGAFIISIVYLIYF